MGENSSISWTTHTFNPWHGCTRIEGSPACGPAPGETGAICYAEAWSERCGYSDKPGAAHFPIWGAHAQRRWLSEKYWMGPEKWNLAAQREGHPARVFCMSMGDWAEGRPDQQPWLERLWPIVLKTNQLNWLMLTKRPQLISKLCPIIDHPRVWQGVTAENQHWLDIRWKHLREVQSIVKWLSVEPMMGPMRLPADFLGLGKCGWVICGGQSGRGAVHMDPNWARDLRDQCLSAGVPFHMKQMSGNTKAELEAIPEDLRIREYPEV